jgi:hypothetical protein
LPIQSAPLPQLTTIDFPILGSPTRNLAEIIAQQTSEQAVLAAKAAPRSLKDIQEEEQFLKWWEQEALKVRRQEEVLTQTSEAAFKENVRRRGGRGRGGVRGRGGARGGGRGI